MKSSIVSLILILFISTSIGRSQTPQPNPPPPPPIPTPISISGPDSFPVYTFAKYSIPGTKGAGFNVYPPDYECSLDLNTSTGILTLTGAPGTFTLTGAYSVPLNGGSQIYFLNKSITITSPSVLSKPLAIAIFDPSTLTSLPAGQASIYNSTTISQSLSSKGIVWLQYSINDVIPSGSGGSPISETSWGIKALKAGLPAFVTQNNGVVDGDPLPQTEEAIVAECSRVFSK